MFEYESNTGNFDKIILGSKTKYEIISNYEVINNNQFITGISIELSILVCLQKIKTVRYSNFTLN